MKLMYRYKQFWKSHKLLMLSLHLILCSLFFTKVAIGNQPILCKYKGEWQLFLFNSKPDDGSQLLADLSAEAQYDYHKLNYDFSIWPIMKLDAKEMDAESAWLPPFSKNQKGEFYLLGSYDLGRDTFAGCIYGLHKSLWLAILTVLISGILGIFIGSVFSFQSQRFEKMSLLSIVLFTVFLLLFFYTIIVEVEWKGLNFSLFLFLIALQLGILFLGVYFLNKSPQYSFKMDFIGLRYIEIMKSIPVILILLILLQIIKNPDVLSLAFIISLVYIPIVAKYARVFTLAASNELYINSIIAIGQTKTMIYWKHILPKIISDIIPILAFGIANIILLEASLSFLGFGLALDDISLGTMMFAARGNPSAWWVVVFPGLLVFWLVVTFNTFGEIWSDRKWIRDFQT